MKFTCKELLESFNKELNYNEIKEIYKALFAYEIGLTEINEEDNAILENAFNNYLDNDYITFDETIENLYNEFSEKIQ